MTRLLLSLVLALWAAPPFAHDARSAAVTVEVVGTGAVVHLAATQAGLHAALEAAAGRALDPADEGYGALVAEHIRTTIRLSADGRPLAVGDVGLRLGSHQSDARFAVELPPDVGTLALAVGVLDGVEGWQVVVRVRQDDGTTRDVLSAETGQTLSIPLAGAPTAVEAVAATAPPPSPVPPSGLSRAWGWWLGLVGMVAALSLLAAVRRSERLPAVA